MFTFSNPLLFWALPVLAIPWIFRRRQEERIRRVNFPLLKFLIESKEKELINPQLQEWLLLILRTLLLAVLLTALAGPKWIGHTTPGGRFLSKLPFASALQYQIIAIDSSYSMAYGSGDESWWKRAQWAWKVIDSERSGFPVDGIEWNRTTLSSHASGRLTTLSPSDIETLFATAPNANGGSLNELLVSLKRTLDGNESIVLITDGQRRPWRELLESNNTLETIPSLLAVTVGQGPVTNAWCRVELLSSPPWGISGWETVAGETGSIRVQGENGSVSIVRTDTGEKLYAQALALPASQTTPTLIPMVFTTRFSDLKLTPSAESGKSELTFSIQVEPEDPLPFDNELTVSVPCITAFKIGIAYDTAAQSPIFPVLKSAINPLADTPESPPVTIETFTSQGYAPDETIDLLILSKPLAPWFAPQHISSTLEYIKNGGAAIVFTDWDETADGIWAQLLSDLGWQWPEVNAIQPEPERVSIGGAGILAQSLSIWDASIWKSWIPTKHGRMEDKQAIPLASYQTGTQTYHLIAQTPLGKGRLWIVNSTLQQDADTLLSPALPAFLWEVGKDVARMKHDYALPQFTERDESDLTLLTDEDKEQISAKYPIRFATLDTLSGELSSFQGGVDLRMLLLFACLGLALFESWLSNHLASM